jgi:nitrate reductase alpha subunit
LPNHEPRGCSRGASYSWYLYSANRVKYPMVRGRLLRLWRAAKRLHKDPVLAWASIVEDPAKARDYKSIRGRGGFARVDWNEANEIVAAANAYTVKTHGPDRVIGFSPIPAMSMVSYAAGSRYLSLIGGVCMSFYDWYCDLPPSSPQTWGEQTDVPESADWYNSGFIMMWGSNVPQTRTPDAHFMTEARYKGTKIVTVTPDYSEASKFADLWLAPKQGTDAALAMAIGHVILKEYHLAGKSPYFENYCRQYTDMPMLVKLVERDGRYVPDRFLRAADFDGGLGETNNPDWKTVAVDELSGKIVAPRGTVGFRWGEQGKWNLEPKAAGGAEIKTRLSLIKTHDHVLPVAFPYFGGREHEHFTASKHDAILLRNVPAMRVKLKDGEALAATVFDLFVANYGIDRGLGGENVASSFHDDTPYTPAWQEKITGVSRDKVIAEALEFADNADKTQGRSMVILGAAVNHWYHGDMIYRGIINMLVMCGCVGQPGGGWSHYVGQEKLRPQTGWTPLAFALDWNRPPRQMNSTSFFYAHTSQWRHEKLGVDEILSPLADRAAMGGSLIDFNARAERMGWLPSAPQLEVNPLVLTKEAAAAGTDAPAYVVAALKAGALRMSCEDPDNPANFPRNMFVWRSNLLGSSGKGHEYFLKYLLGAQHGVQGKDLGEEGGSKPTDVKWRETAPEGKLDLLVTLDFRMSTTCMYSDVVLPTATWYEKHDLNTSDMHPFIHPLSAAVDPAWQARSDWEIFKGIAKKFSEVCVGHLGVEKDLVLVPIMHDTPGELAQPYLPKDWKKGECEPVPGKTMPAMAVVERDYPNTYRKFTALGPLMAKIGNGGKGIAWNTEAEVKLLAELNKIVTEEGVAKGLPRIETDMDAAEVILTLAPETNGQVAVKAWEALAKATGREHAHLARPREDEKLRFRDLQAQPRKIISSPTWSGIESEHVTYNAGYTNVHELIPWRTLTGRQQLYQDHPWMLAFGEGLCVYRPPIDTKTTASMLGKRGNGNPELVLNFITPHQKWGIHSTYTDNLLMLTLSRGGPIVWLGEIDAKKIGVEDNDWIEAFNVNGALVARAVVSQRVPEGMVLMYHAQEKIVNVPGSEITQARGGIHNSVTRTCPKPTHMIGGYAQQSYGFNYHGTIGTNRDEFVIVRKMAKVDWLDAPLAQSPAQAAE